MCVSLSEVSSAACLHAEEFREIKSEEVTGSRRCRKMCDTQCCEASAAVQRVILVHGLVVCVLLRYWETISMV